MNISSGGPQILLFERDQQLASLLTSELQLAGYGCLTARTAVEVFDAMARHPIKLVLVNLAQAAAGRREFWVALDTQRRGRGIQVFSFHCANIAGYGSLDLEEFPANITPDMYVEGMPGIISLIDAIQVRLPNTPSATMPRVTSPRPPVQPQSAQVQASPFMPNMAPTSDFPSPPMPSMPSLPLRGSAPPPQQMRFADVPSSPTQQMRFADVPSSPPQQMPFTDAPPPPPPPASSTSSQVSSYSEKIRAVLYPNQRNWSVSSTFNGQAEQRTNNQGRAYDHTQFTTQPAHTPISAPPPVAHPAAEASVLQRLANGQADDSSLAQLSRMVQERRTAMGYAPPPPPPQAEPMPVMRPAPIQDLPPLPKSTSAQEPHRYPDAPVRSHQHVEPPPPPAMPTYEPKTAPLPPTSVPLNVARSTPAPPAVQISSSPAFKEVTHTSEPEKTVANSAKQQYNDKTLASSQAAQAREAFSAADPHNDVAVEPKGSSRTETIQVDKDHEKHSDPAIETNPMTNNALLMDILQSLPPMPALPPQQPRTEPPFVLNGRATRTLGSVLLAGHLVPEDRLDVAQQIQRMLSGVDLNYQLGEILLMFKLLTPDQLLAASLVSYGLINTTQISALGRIRQDLHAIGLDYDLENLLIMFRILTPEQVREVKSSWQG